MKRLQKSIAEAHKLMEAALKGADFDWVDERMARKEAEWKYVNQEIIDLSKAPAGAIAFIRGLKKFRINDAYANTSAAMAPNGVLAELKPGMPQWFILDLGKDFYLVNTEGGTYARYIGKLTGMNKI